MSFHKIVPVKKNDDRKPLAKKQNAKPAAKKAAAPVSERRRPVGNHHEGR
jgi:hypothetical protein